MKRLRKLNLGLDGKIKDQGKVVQASPIGRPVVIGLITVLDSIDDRLNKLYYRPRKANAYVVGECMMHPRTRIGYFPIQFYRLNDSSP